MTKKFSKWIKFSGTSCPVNPNDIVIVRLGEDLTLGEQQAHTLNWDKGVITAYRVQTGTITPPISLEQCFSQIIEHDNYSECNPFNKINLEQLNYTTLFKHNPQIMQDFIRFLYIRLDMILNLDEDYVSYELMDMKAWLCAKEIFDNIDYVYKSKGISVITNFSEVTKKMALEQINDFKKIIQESKNSQLELMDYINFVEEIYILFFNK